MTTSSDSHYVIPRWPRPPSTAAATTTRHRQRTGWSTAAHRTATTDRSLLSRVRACNAGVQLGNGQRLPVTAEGEVTIVLPPLNKKLTFTARFVPGLRRNLLSVGALGRQGIHVLCAGPLAHIFHVQSRDEIGQAVRIEQGSEYNLYRIDPIHDSSPLHTALLSCQSDGTQSTIQSRCGTADSDTATHDESSSYSTRARRQTATRCRTASDPTAQHSCTQTDTATHARSANNKLHPSRAASQQRAAPRGPWRSSTST